MANYESHHLFGVELKQNLLEAGVLEEVTPDTHLYELGYRYILRYAKCSQDEWDAQLIKILERGVVDCSKQNPDGSYGVRRDYTPEEQNGLGWYPVRFDDDGNEMTWISKWVVNEDPAYYASVAVPTQCMILDMYYEDTYDGGCYLKAGKKVAEKPVISFADPDILEAAIIALNTANLGGFVDEMVNRYNSVAESENGRTIEDQRISVVLDYVCVPPEPEICDEAPEHEPMDMPATDTDEPQPESSEVPF